MNEDERGYRDGRPLADIIPPDRRRLKAAALVVGGMIAGAAFLVLTQHAFDRRAATSTPRRAPQIIAFASGPATPDVTSKRAGRITGDDEPDWTFELVVVGSVLGIGLVQCDEHGVPLPNAARWGTLAHDDVEPAHSSRGLPGYGRWQLAVAEEGRVLNDPLGGLPPLSDGYHRLVLTASMTGQATDVCATVIGEDHAIAKTGPAHVMPIPPSTPTAPAAAGPPFDRGAAAAALGAVNIVHCAKLAGARSTGRIEVTFTPDGRVSQSAVIEGIEPTTPAAQCIAGEFERQPHIPPFGGAAVHVKKSFSLNL